MATAAGRVGFTRDRLMVFFKGGAAWADTRYSASINLGELTDGEQSVSVKKTRVGALFGTGLEYAFLPNWSAKVEYNYIDFGHKNYTFDLFEGDILIGTKINERMHVVKGGLNWRFNSPVVAAY
jgi:outer membrane immunogenic protein